MWTPLLENKNLKIINDLFTKANYELYAVGGCIRNLFLGKPITDIDLTTNATPDQMKKILLGYSIHDVGIDHGTLIVNINSEMFEITTYRIDGRYSDSRRPDEVIFAKTIEEDLERRDFTMNAIAFNLNTALTIDPFNGRKDIENKIIKCVNHPSIRFNEDPLRMMRACRFASQYKFKIESKTFSEMYTICGSLKRISAERISIELIKILLSDNPEIGLNLLLESRLIHFIIPELVDTFHCVQNKYHLKDVWNHTLEVVSNIKNNLHCRMAALLHDVGKPRTKVFDEDTTHFYGHSKESSIIALKTLYFLKFGNVDLECINLLVKNHMFDASKEDKHIKRLFIKMHEDIDLFKKLMWLRIADFKSSKSEKLQEELELTVYMYWRLRKLISNRTYINSKDLKINGYDLKELGFIPGTIMGKIIRELGILVLDEELENDKTILLNYIKENYSPKIL